MNLNWGGSDGLSKVTEEEWFQIAVSLLIQHLGCGVESMLPTCPALTVQSWLWAHILSAAGSPCNHSSASNHSCSSPQLWLFFFSWAEKGFPYLERDHQVVHLNIYQTCQNTYKKHLLTFVFANEHWFIWFLFSFHLFFLAHTSLHVCISLLHNRNFLPIHLSFSMHRPETFLLDGRVWPHLPTAPERQSASWEADTKITFCLFMRKLERCYFLLKSVFVYVSSAGDAPEENISCTCIVVIFTITLFWNLKMPVFITSIDGQIVSGCLEIETVQIFVSTALFWDSKLAPEISHFILQNVLCFHSVLSLVFWCGENYWCYIWMDFVHLRDIFFALYHFLEIIEAEFLFFAF